MKDPFWAIIGILFVAYIGVYFFLISPEEKKVKKDLDKVKKDTKILEDRSKEEIPGEEMITQYQSYRQELQKSYKALCEEYKSADSKFEGWFQKLNVQAGDEPKPADFNTELNDQINAIKQQLTPVEGEKKWPIVAGASKKGSDPFNEAIQFYRSPANGLKMIQKCWWMFAQAMDACKKHQVKVIHKWSWWEKIDLTEYEIGRVSKPADPLPEGAEPPENTKPQEIFFGYQKLPMKMTLEIPHAHVAPFLAELLDSSGNKRVSFELKSFSFRKGLPNQKIKKEPFYNETVYWERFPLPSEEENEFKELLVKVEQEIAKTEKNVVVQIELFAYDFIERVQDVPEPVSK